MKQFSAKRSVQILGHILQEYGIDKMVISPGSRNASIAVHFSELENMQCYSIVDERSAGFVGLGMAKSIKRPVALSCTSGSAVVNYYPAIVEAFYGNIPLLVITADRPQYLIDLFDGQTIRQNQIFAQHTYGSFNLLEDNETDANEKNFGMINDAVKLCIAKQGPVHINIPLSEPLYEYVSEIPSFQDIKKEEKSLNSQYTLPYHLVEKWNKAKKILILTGSLDKNPELENLLAQLAKNHSAVILTEINSNLNHPKFFAHIDRYFFHLENDEKLALAPDLLITIGQNVVSKKVKEFLRNCSLTEHWHIDRYWQPDTYFSITESIETLPEEFLSQFIPHISLQPSDYYNIWNEKREILEAKHQKFVAYSEFSDFKIYDIIKSQVPEHYNIHFANSSVIRYAQLFDFSPTHHFYCNRGANGIDGSTSTAMGFAMMNKKPTLLITGDLSFFYDINGLWNQYIPPYTRIIIVNNGEGNIFRIIPGPDSTNSVDEFIATKHHRNAEDLAKAFGFNYFKVFTQEDLERSLGPFFSAGEKPKILEIDTSKINNAKILKEYFNSLKK